VTNPCQAYRDALLSAGVSGGALPEHVSGCAACAAWTRTAARLVGELTSLERQQVPVELEGRVVAALEAGYRQARAALALADLGRMSSPPELDQAVDADLEGSAGRSEELPARLRVPGVLDRLVAEELADFSRARARRYLGTLRRKRAPEELRLRVAGALQSAGTAAGAVEVERRGARGLAVRLTLGLAAAVGLIGLGSLLSKPTATHAAELRPEPIVEHVSDPSELNVFAAALFDGASGGLLSARQL
jgi:hypothetical protein